VKGQWFIISAVVASSIFLGISLLLKDYFIVDSSIPATVSNDHYFYNINHELDSIVANTPTSPADCTNLITNLDSFRTLAGQEMAARGILLSLEYNVIQCSPNRVNFDLLLASNDQIIYNFSTRKFASEIIG
jgi:hypothetical protein